MKKYLILFVFALMTTVAAQAQVGLRVGANYSDYRGDGVIVSTDRLIGAHAGLYTMIPLSVDNFFSLKPEVLFSTKGSKFNNETERLYYLDVPVLAHINAGPLYFEGGPQLSLRVGDNADIDLNHRRFGLGYAAGVGIGTPMGISLGVRYNGDISRLNDGDGANFYNDLFMLTLGYTLGVR